MVGLCRVFQPRNKLKGGDVSLDKNYGDNFIVLPNRQNLPLGFTDEIHRHGINTFGITLALLQELSIRYQR